MKAANRPIPTLYMRGGWLLGPGFAVILLILLIRPAFQAVRSWWSDPVFRRLQAALGVPAAVLALGSWLQPLLPASAPWLVPLAMLAASISIAGNVDGLGVRLRGTPTSAALGAAVVGTLGVTMLRAYQAYEVPLRAVPPEAEWLPAALPTWLYAAAIDLWLRGVVFTRAQAWKGTAAALVVSTLPMAFVARGSPPELFLWAVFTGAIFGLIRSATGDVLGLGVARAFEWPFLQALP